MHAAAELPSRCSSARPLSLSVCNVAGTHPAHCEVLHALRCMHLDAAGVRSLFVTAHWLYLSVVRVDELCGVALDMKHPLSRALLELQVLKLHDALTPNNYHVQSLTVLEATHQVHAQLQHGTHTFVSEDIRLGIVHSLEDKALLGRVSFKYTLDTRARTIIVCATDFGSADGMHLVTLLEGTVHSCIARAAAAGFPEDDVSPSRGWDFRTPMTPGADAVFKGMARSANDSLVSALKKARRLTVLERSPFPDFSQERYLQLSRGLGSDQRGWPGKGVKSSFGGMATLDENIGSTDDFYPKGYHSWISLWEDKTGITAEGCASYQFDGYQCSEPNGTGLKGGHVVMYGQDREPKEGADGVVFIIPICTQHNNDDDAIMAPLDYKQGVWLNDYLLKDE